MRIGVISDTHGLLRPEALAALSGAEMILHAGDVGDEAVLRGLERLGPVTAVRGNTDRGAWAEKLPKRAALELASVAIYLHHGHEPLDLDPAAGGFGVVIQGHSHQPRLERLGGVLYLNPGSAGPRRFTLPLSVARLTLADGRAEAELLELPV